MSETEEIIMERLLAEGKRIVWLGDSPRMVAKIAPCREELDMKVAYVGGGKPGEYVALFNCAPEEFLVGEYLSYFTK
jgi:hypothetical protein